MGVMDYPLPGGGSRERQARRISVVRCLPSSASPHHHALMAAAEAQCVALIGTALFFLLLRNLQQPRLSLAEGSQEQHFETHRLMSEVCAAVTSQTATLVDTTGDLLNTAGGRVSVGIHLFVSKGKRGGSLRDPKAHHCSTIGRLCPAPSLRVVDLDGAPGHRPRFTSSSTLSSEVFRGFS